MLSKVFINTPFSTQLQNSVILHIAIFFFHLGYCFKPMGIMFVTFYVFKTLVIQIGSTYLELWYLTAKSLALFFAPIKVFFVAFKFCSGRLVAFLKVGGRRIYRKSSQCLRVEVAGATGVPSVLQFCSDTPLQITALGRMWNYVWSPASSSCKEVWQHLPIS